MAAPAVLKQPSGQMVIPLSALVSAFHLHPHWNARRRLLTLTGADLMNNINSDTLADVGLEQPSTDTTRLIPFSADFGGPGNEAHHRLQFKARNASSRTLAASSAYINLVDAGEMPARMTPPHGPYQANYVISGPRSPKTIYIAAWLVTGRVSNPGAR